MDAAFELVPSRRTWTLVGRPRSMSRANPGSTRITPSTRPRSMASCISFSLAGVAAMINRPEPRNCDKRSRLCGVWSWSIQAMRAVFTSRFAAYPKISNWISGGMNSRPRMRGSRKTWRNSLRMMERRRCLMSGYLLPEFSDREEGHSDGVQYQQQQVEPQQFQTGALEENPFGHVDEIPRRNDDRDHTDNPGHVGNRIDESGKQERR